MRTRARSYPSALKKSAALGGRCSAARARRGHAVVVAAVGVAAAGGTRRGAVGDGFVVGGDEADVACRVPRAAAGTHGGEPDGAGRAAAVPGGVAVAAL